MTKPPTSKINNSTFDVLIFLKAQADLSIDSTVADSSAKGRSNMTKLATTLTMALAVALSAAMWTSNASAAVRGTEAGRDTAIEKCLGEAHKRFAGLYYNFDQTRAFVYASCMHDAGQPR